MEEMLAIFDDSFNPIGTAPRSQVHTEGLLHQVVHCWIIGEKESVLYFQQRAHDKCDFPDCYDIACGGHVDPGELADAAMVREMREELGLHVSQSELVQLGRYRVPDLKLPGFYDRAFSNVYVLRRDKPAFEPGEEVSRMIKVSIDEFCRMELEGAEEIEIITPEQTSLRVKKEEWCCHDGEFAARVLPYLKTVFPELEYRRD